MHLKHCRLRYNNYHEIIKEIHFSVYKLHAAAGPLELGRHYFLLHKCTGGHSYFNDHLMHAITSVSPEDLQLQSYFFLDG